MPKKTENQPATWCSYCHAFVVSCVHSGGRPPAHKPVDPRDKPKAEKPAKKTRTRK